MSTASLETAAMKRSIEFALNRSGGDRTGSAGKAVSITQSDRRHMMSSTSQHSGRSVAVTGAGGGLGRDIALGLAAKGYIVFGTAMSAEEVQDLKDASGGRVSLTVCAITKEEAVKAWAGGVSDALGDSGLHILINNAGILTPGPIEVLPLDAIRREFDVNVFGALSVINAFLPALRKARGRIIQVSTWTASVPLP